MAEVTLKNRAGADAGTVELDEAVFGVQPNVPVMHQVVTAQLARRRAGTQSTKTRSEVRGGGAKPYRQKGTGNARQGSIRAPHYAGGGVALGPKPRSYAQRTPKKMIRLALRSALSDRAAAGRVVVVDSWSFEAPRTKDAKAALAALGLDGRVLVVVDRDDATTALSFRNLPEVQLIQPGELNAYDVLCNDWIVFTTTNLPVDTSTPGEPPAPRAPEPVVHPQEPAEGPDEPATEPEQPAPRPQDPAEGADDLSATDDVGSASGLQSQDAAEGPRDVADASATGIVDEVEQLGSAVHAQDPAEGAPDQPDLDPPADARSEGAEPSTEASAASTEDER